MWYSSDNKGIKLGDLVYRGHSLKLAKIVSDPSTKGTVEILEIKTGVKHLTNVKYLTKVKGWLS